MKKFVAGILAVLLLICLTSAIAAGGTATDPLLSKSYIDGTFVPAMLQSGLTAVQEAFDAFKNDSLAKLESKYNYYAALADGRDKASFAGQFTPLYISLDSAVQLWSGTTVICTDGGAKIDIPAGTVINISTGEPVTSGAALTLGERYFCAEDTAATVTGTANGSLLVDGYYLPGADVGTVMAPTAKAVVATMQTIHFNDQPIQLEAYNIDGYNYFKLRDIAYLMMNTPVTFSVSAAGERALVLTAKGGAYVPVGGELATGQDNSATCVPSAWRLLVDEQCAPVYAYNIGGYNFFKLRDLGDALGFTVDYDYDTGTVLIYSR